MTPPTTALLFQCTTGRVEFFNLNREWRPSRRAQLRKPTLVFTPRATSSSPSPSSATTNAAAAQGEPTIDELLTKLEQGSTPASSTTTPNPVRRAGGAPRGRSFAVADEELVVDKVLTGKVKAIMTYGAFIDLGARTDGLLHISKLNAGFVKSIEDVLQVGQELQVQIIEADLANRRVKVARYDPNAKPDAGSEGGGAPRRVAPRSSGGTPRRTEVPKSEYQKGQALTGVVKTLTGRGCFVGLPNGEEGFLASNEIVAGGEKSPIDALVKVGQQVNVKVLRIMQGRLNLTMKEEIDLKKVNQEMNENIFATNAFELAFRQHPGIRKYLEDSGQLPDQNQEEPKSKKKKKAEADEAAVAAASEEASAAKVADEAEGSQAETLAPETEEAEVEAKDPAPVASEDVTAGEAAKVADEAEGSQAETLAPETEEAEVEAKNPAPVASEDGTAGEAEADEAVASAAAVDPEVDQKVSALEVAEIREEAEADVKQKVAAALDALEAEEETKEAADVAAPVEASEPGEVKATEEQVLEEEAQPEEIPPAVTAQAEDSKVVDEVKTPEEEPKAPVDEVKTPEEEPREPVAATAAPAFTISPSLVKELRQQSGAGMMDCKKALVETKGSFEAAIEYLRKKGLAGADKKASRIAAEGAIGSYIHDGRIGVLVEVNCETDFVARGELFGQLVEDLAMQIAASQQVEFVNVEDVPEEVRSKEFEIEMQREDLQSKPENIRAKIVEGRVAKRFGDLALLEQPFIKDDGVVIRDLVRQTSASVGEKIQVRRFTRFILGEGLEKRTYDIASEVAAQAKAQEERVVAAADVEEEQKPEEKNPEVQETAGASVSVSAALVKQLREETGSGMMDCKKALMECGGDIEEAREYLRKKGLASAEKKSGRIAAEGLVVSYVHSSRAGVLVEVNCETDFVARNSVFKELAEDLAMQLVASPQVEFVSVDDIPGEFKEKERELEMQREDLQDKPEQIRAKIVEGRLSKLVAEKALLEQPYLKDDSIRVKDLVKQTTVSLGENIRVRRFVRYNLGEGIEKKSVDLAQEIAALQSS